MSLYVYLYQQKALGNVDWNDANFELMDERGEPIKHTNVIDLIRQFVLGKGEEKKDSAAGFQTFIRLLAQLPYSHPFLKEQSGKGLKRPGDHTRAMYVKAKVKDGVPGVKKRKTLETLY